MVGSQFGIWRDQQLINKCAESKNVKNSSFYTTWSSRTILFFLVGFVHIEFNGFTHKMFFDGSVKRLEMLEIHLEMLEIHLELLDIHIEMLEILLEMLELNMYVYLSRA